jgi:cardiolipin synthase
MRLLPNIISLLRLLSVPIVIWLLLIDERAAAFWLFLAAGLSDAVDGLIAKRFDAVTEVGTYLDPIADKVLLVSVFLALGGLELMRPWVVILVVSRDVLIVGGILFSYAISLPLQAAPSILSKVSTFGQMLLAAAVLGGHGMLWQLDRPIEFLTYAVGLLTAASGAHYVLHWARTAFVTNQGAER